MEDQIPEGYVRVTEVLKPFTPFERMEPDSNFAKNVKAAADRGQRVHELCEAYATGLFVEECDADCRGYFEAFRAWFDEMVGEVIMAEKRINSGPYRLSGAIDLVCILKGDSTPSIVDIKTPASPSKTWQLQTAAYALLLEQAGVSVTRRLCLMLPRAGGNVEIKEYDEHPADRSLFLHCLKLYRFFNG